jgi:glycine dehydrogenase subunit 1
MVCELTGMEVANASMYDASTALAESALMACQITGRSKVVVSQAVHPHYRQALRTYLWTNSRQLVEVPAREGITDLDALTAALDDETACAMVQYPNFFGAIESLSPVSAAAHRVGALAIACVDPIALGVLKPPGEYDFDIVVGEGQGWATRWASADRCWGCSRASRRTCDAFQGASSGRRPTPRAGAGS